MVNEIVINKLDIKDFQLAIENKVFEFEGKKYQYALEKRNNVWQIVELNFKPNTKTTMAVPLIVLNEYLTSMAYITKINKEIKANDTMALFIPIYEKYRRDYLHTIKSLKPSSYTRYGCVIYLMFNVLKDKFGYTAYYRPKEKTYIVTETIDNTTNKKTKKSKVIEPTFTSNGYYIKRISNEINTFNEKSQKCIGEF